MEKEPPTQAQDTSTKISDSNYGSLIAESSSSCLSLLSESDFLDDPSTSGCSSEMASHMQSREKKRQKVKEFLRELKSMVPQQSSGSKLGTLSTLDYVVSSMRKITEVQKQDKGGVFKAPSSEPVALPSLQCTESVDFRNVNDGIVLNTQSELTVAVSLKNHVVLHTSQALMDLLGYPNAWWKGRLLKDFVHKKDVMTVNSYISSENSEGDGCPTESRSQGKTDSPKQQKQFFYARIRRFRSLSSGFSLSSAGTYVFFKVMATSKPLENLVGEGGVLDDQKVAKRCMMLYFAPMASPYKDGQLPPEPEQRTFSLRHSLFCTYTYTHANTVALLGFLPQDIVGTSIFDYYHPDDLPQLLDIYKKAMHSMGQPFKSGPLRIRTRNGTYVKVTTEWSSFMNPWDHKLEFIIAQHTIIKAPDNPNVFEESPDDRKLTEARTSETSRKLISKITEMLQKPMSFDTMPLTPSDSGGAAGSPVNTGGSTPVRDSDKTKEKGKNENSTGQTSASDISSSIIDEKSISSLYNQVNYSLNIKKFLLSHPKAFPVSDEDSSTDVVHKDDSEEDLNEEEEMQVEIPVCRPPSCGSSTQVHVSEQGFHEEVPSPPSFGGEDPNQTGREALDNQLMLTEDSLRKHTKAQELLYLQEASKEQPHLFHLKSRRQVMQRNRQKRSRPSGHEETTDVFKFARNSKNQRGAGNSGSPGLFMSNFPITAVDIQPTPSQPTNSAGLSSPAPNVVGVVPGHFQPGMGVMPQLTMLPIDPATGITLQPHLQPFLPSPTNNMQWPYYPQSGYSLLPQVMAGFYQPLLQPMPMTPVTQAPPFSEHPPCTTTPTFSHPAMQQQPPKTKEQQKNSTDSDNPPSSTEETSSSIQYLLDAVSGNNSSPNEETDEKNRPRQKVDMGGTKLTRRRLTVPPWLQTVNWTPEVRLTYQLPVQKAKSVLKKDREALKKMAQSEQVKGHLETLLEEVDSPDYLPALDEEADYIFYPAGRTGDAPLTASEEEGEKTPRDTLSPTVAFQLGPTATTTVSSADNNNAHDSGAADTEDGVEGEEASPGNGVCGVGGCVEVVVTEDPPEPMAEEELAPEPMNLTEESMEKVHSPASEGSSNSSSGKEEGSASVGEEGSGVEGGEREAGEACRKSPEGVGEAAMETKSPKDAGCSSDDGRSDAGSDKGSENSSQNSSRQKSNEDAQSSSSKVSSSLTPSDERSTEDASSSMKESDLSTGKGSFASSSSSSSNDKMSTDSGAESASTPRPDVLEKLFVPLRVSMCPGEAEVEVGVGATKKKPKVWALPFWQQEAHLTPDVAMRYNLRPLDLATILANDRRRLAGMTQPDKVSGQLLELLHEMEGQGHKGGFTTTMAMAGAGAESSTTTTTTTVTTTTTTPITGDDVHMSSEGPSSSSLLSSSRSGETSSSSSSSSKLMQPPSIKHPRSSEPVKKSHLATDAAQGRNPKPASLQTQEGEGQAGARGCLKKQLLDKLQSLTSGQPSESWPGDVIMNRVFLPVDLVSSTAATETAGRAHSSEIMDSVD
ncbi:uncharacterized protein LOC143301809 isoform X2 [Babylonia areolata]|uniref:uncharacterized protein LOC143301809 isoform X2 n=1 Tax=Babylonia areolata TaxID=304850 RepID=UPI003FD1160B